MYSLFTVLTLIAAVNGNARSDYDELVRNNRIAARPQYNFVAGRYLSNPGLYHKPNFPGTKDAGIIRFNKARASTYRKYVDQLTAALEPYSYSSYGNDAENLVDCAANVGYKPEELWDKECRIDLDPLTASCMEQQSFGYEDGMPCVLLTLERIDKWVPEPYNESGVPDNVRPSWDEYSVTVTCEGMDAQSKDNIGNTNVYPPHGFEFKYFPYRRNYGARKPIVFVQFESIRPAVALHVNCTAWAENMMHSTRYNTGSTHFWIMVD